MPSSRLFQLLSLLLECQHTTAHALAASLGVSESTVYRDVDALAAAGVPILTSQGRGGGVWLAPGHCLDRDVFSPEAQRALLSALQSGQEQTEQAALARLSALFRPQQPLWLQVVPARRGGEGRDAALFDTLRTAILERQVLELTYAESPEEPLRFCVFPARLSCLGQIWTCQCWCPRTEEYRTFRLSRILSLSPTGQYFHRPLDPPPLTLPHDIPPLFRVEAELRFSPAAARRVWDEFDGDCIQTQADGSLLVRAVFPREPWLCGYLLSYGPALEVLAPAELRDQLRQMAAEICAIHQGS